MVDFWRKYAELYDIIIYQDRFEHLLLQKEGTIMNKQAKKPLSTNHVFSIRNKIIVCFLVPIFFMIVIGLASYNKAASGMTEKYLESTTQTIQMAGEYLEMSCDFVETEAMKYAFDKEVSKYCLGSYTDVLEKKTIMDKIKANTVSAQLTNPFISDIHIIPSKGANTLSTSMNGTIDGFFAEYKETVANEKSIQKWIETHEMLDEKLSSNPSKYLMACELLTETKGGCVVVDVKTETISNFLNGIELGNGSYVAFITAGGREVVVDPSTDEISDISFFGQDFYQELLSAPAESEEGIQGSEKVKFNGTNYLFFYRKSLENGAAVCALVPQSLVTGQAESIKTLTYILIVLATLIAVLLGIYIVHGIQNNLRKMHSTLGEVSKGNLTVRAKASGKDEFQELASSTNNMINNTKNLVTKVNDASSELGQSADEVGKVSGLISDYSVDITDAIDQINLNMQHQAEHAENCVSTTDKLSVDIQEITEMVEDVRQLVTDTVNMVSQGIELIAELHDQASSTNDMTAQVRTNIESLHKASEIINSFVKTITDISGQTNLLSLNASIEAARAGEAGRGFAVVAEEIRKLADDSAKAAGEIRANVEQITTSTNRSVTSAISAQEMVQNQAVSINQMVEVFHSIQDRMENLNLGLKEIEKSTAKADAERDLTVDAVKSISAIIDETASSALVVRDISEKLMEHVNSLNNTAKSLDDHMEDLNTEISAFKI